MAPRNRPRHSSFRADLSRDMAARTAIGRAEGRHRRLLIATCLALITAAVADAATGYDGPGPFVYPAFALAVAMFRWRYTPLLAVAMSVFFIVGGLASSAFARRLIVPGDALDFTAGWAQMLGFAAAGAFAVVAVVRAPRSSHITGPSDSPVDSR